MATIVRMGPDGKLTLGRMLPHEELQMYGKFNPGPCQFLQKRRETFRQRQEEQRLALQKPEGDE